MRQQDLETLTKLVEDFDGQLRDGELEAFMNMRAMLLEGQFHCLTDKQRAWAKKKLEEFQPEYENLVSSGKVPRGNEVQSMVGPLPKKPPQKPKTND